MKFRATALPNQSTTSALSIHSVLSNGCKLHSSKPPIYLGYSTRPIQLKHSTLNMSSSSTSKQNSQESTSTITQGPEKLGSYSVKFLSLEDCKLGISRYPDFDYNALGGTGTATGTRSNGKIPVSFDLKKLYIPPLSSSTTKFLGLPLPPFLKIDIVPELFQGTIDEQTGQVDLEFKAKFLFSVGSIYRAPPLLVGTVLTSEESRGEMKSGRGKRLDGDGKCRLVGVATVDPIDDIFMNSFLGLPTECLANLNAKISISNPS